MKIFKCDLEKGIVCFEKGLEEKKYTVGFQELKELPGSVGPNTHLPLQPLWCWEASGFSLKKIYPTLGSSNFHVPKTVFSTAVH